MRDRRLDLAFPDRIGQLAETLLGETGAVFVTWLIRIFIDQIDGQLQRPAVPTGRLVQQAGQITDGIQSETRGFRRRSGRSSLFFRGHQAISILLNTKRIFGLVIDFGTSQSPKSTRPLTTYWCPSRPGHQALRNNFASSLLLRTCLPMTGRRVRRPTLFSLWRKARRENSAASRLLGTTSLRFALHGWQRRHLIVNVWQVDECLYIPLVAPV